MIRLKIGEFADKFGISKETIRFYVSKKLLIPVKNGSFFVYDENCEGDLKTILLMKSLNFSLDEIVRYLSFIRLSSKRMKALHNEMIALFEGKIDEVQTEINRLQQSKDILSKRLDEIRAIEIPREKEIGLPLALSASLVCPDCGSSLMIQNGRISNNEIISGDIRCECGYGAEIKEGIIVFEGASFSDLFEEHPEWLDHEKMLPPEYISTSIAAVNRVTQNLLLEELKGKILFDHGTQSGVLSNLIIEKLIEKTTDFTLYGLDTHFTLIRQFKDIFSLQPKRPHALFMCGNIEKAPIRKASCDLIYSCFGLQTHSFSSGKDGFDGVKSLMKEGGRWFETFFCTENKKDIRPEYADKAAFLVYRELRNRLSDIGAAHFLDCGTTKELGETRQYFRENTEVKFFSYAGIK